MNNCYRPCPPTYPDYYLPCIDLGDHGPEPYVVNIEEATKQNPNFRTALWTGTYLQLTLMSLNPREDIGLEVHPDVDQFIRVEEGEGLTLMGDTPNYLYFQERVSADDVILIPAGKWHNLINIGCTPLKLYSIYAPPEHPHGTVHETKEDAEHEHGYHHIY
jgi:mannose-6-phosphate isomerase-like protein (cupin superfamily)